MVSEKTVKIEDVIIIITYRKAVLTDMDEMALVHTICFKDYFLTSFGEKLVAKYYEEFFCEDDLFVIAQNENGDIVGFAMGYMHGSEAREKFEKKYRVKLAMNLIVRCLKLEKLALRKCFARVKSMIQKNNKKEQTVLSSTEKLMGELLSICVLSQWRGHNVAQNLIMQFEKLLLERNAKSYSLTVLSENKRAGCFYEKCGFVKVSENRMEAVYSKNI